MRPKYYKGICIIFAVAAFFLLLAACSDSEPDYIYGISLSHSEYTFDPVFIDYETPAPLTVTVTNTGDKAIDNTLDVRVSSWGENVFTLSTTSLDSISKGGTATFTVSPNTGLSVGIHTGTVTVSGYAVNLYKWISEELDINFMVAIPPSAELSAYYWVEQDQLVLNAASSTVNLSRKAGQSVSIAPQGSAPQGIAPQGAGYSNQRWYVNGEEVTGLDNPQSYTFSSVGRLYGRYTIGLSLRKDNGAFYYAEMIISVIE